MTQAILVQAGQKVRTWGQVPVVRKAGTGVLCFGGGFLMSGLRIWGQMQPGAAGLTAACTGWQSVLTGLGSAAGYRFFWGPPGMQGVLWAVGAVALALLLPLALRSEQPMHLAAGVMCLTAGVGLALQAEGAPVEPGIFALRIALAGGAALTARQAIRAKDRLWRWVGIGTVTVSLAGISPWLGWAVSGAAAAALPLPAAAVVGLGADLGAGSRISLTAVACVAFFLQRVFPREDRKRMAAPAVGCGILMLLQGAWEPGILLAVGLGGGLGALIPWKYTVVPRRSRVGSAQVRLEQTAQVLTRFRRELLEYAPPGPELPPTQEARREQLRRMKATRARQEEYRMALVQQYGFLADALHDLSDRLPEREHRRKVRFRVKVSARSRGRELTDGDRVSAFPGTECRYYVILCDGMGTGQGAAEESRTASELIRQMLTAGLSPETVLGSVNSQLALTDRGGAVTVDLAEIRLDNGRAMLYKWGAGPSWLLHRRHGSRIGTAGPPPGLGVTAGSGSASRLSLASGETLVMLSDGVACEAPAQWAAAARNLDPGTLAKQILEDSGREDDDATAVVVKLCEKEPVS